MYYTVMYVFRKDISDLNFLSHQHFEHPLIATWAIIIPPPSPQENLHQTKIAFAVDTSVVNLTSGNHRHHHHHQTNISKNTSRPHLNEVFCESVQWSLCGQMLGQPAEGVRSVLRLWLSVVFIWLLVVAGWLTSWLADLQQVKRMLFVGGVPWLYFRINRS